MFRTLHPALIGMVFAGALSLSTAAPAQTISNKDFEWALDRAKSSSGSLNNSLIKPKDGKSIPLVKAIESSGPGKWAVAINGAWLTSSTAYRTVTFAGVVANTGRSLEYAFLGQPVDAHLVEGIRKHKGMVKAEKAWIKKHKDMEVQVGVEGNRISLQGRYPYAQGTDRGDVADRLKLLFTASNGVLVWTEYAGRDVEKDYAKDQKKAMKRKLTSVSKVEFPALVGEDLASYESTVEDVKEGYWLFTMGEREHEIYNHGDAAELTYYRTIPSSIRGSDRDEVFKKIARFVDKNDVKHARRQETVWYNDDIIWIKIHFPFDGKLRAEDFKEGYSDFFYEYGPKLHREVDKVLSKY